MFTAKAANPSDASFHASSLAPFSIWVYIWVVEMSAWPSIS